MELGLITTIAAREFRAALRNKWLAVSTIGLALLSLALSRVSLASAGYSGLGGFGRTAASMVNALLLFVPLLGLSVGADALAGDRERGTLIYLLAQPVSRAEAFLGKVMGAALAATTALVIGFGLAAIALSSGGIAEVGAFISLAGYATLLVLASLGLGFLTSAISRTGVASISTALFIWLVLVFLGDVGIIGATLSFRPSPSALLGLLLINPLQVFKLGSIYSLQATLDSLGAIGQFAIYRFGTMLPFLLVGILLIWTCLSFSLAYVLFKNWRNI